MLLFVYHIEAFKRPAGGNHAGSGQNLSGQLHKGVSIYPVNIRRPASGGRYHTGNLYLNHKSRQTRSQNYLKHHPPETVSPESIERELIQKEQTSAVINAMQKLDDPYKEVFSLRAFSDLSFKEIGKMLGKNDSWARVTYHRAKLKVKEELKDEY